MTPTPTQILNVVQKLDSRGQIAVAAIAAAVLQTQKNSEKKHLPACPLTSSGAEIIHEAMKKGVQCK